jgi:hypothetical protein
MGEGQKQGNHMGFAIVQEGRDAVDSGGGGGDGWMGWYS